MAALRRWRASEIAVAIYSSGSVLAQQLLFAHTPTGDLTPLVNRFFDTEVGAKTSPDSYRRIAAALRCQTDRLLFVSDASTELDAARQAGCEVLLCARPGNPTQSPPPGLHMIHGFDEIGVGE
jgi:enolase-phosphatase E1